MRRTDHQGELLASSWPRKKHRNRWLSKVKLPFGDCYIVLSPCYSLLWRLSLWSSFRPSRPDMDSRPCPHWWAHGNLAKRPFEMAIPHGHQALDKLSKCWWKDWKIYNNSGFLSTLHPIQPQVPFFFLYHFSSCLREGIRRGPVLKESSLLHDALTNKKMDGKQTTETSCQTSLINIFTNSRVTELQAADPVSLSGKNLTSSLINPHPSRPVAWPRQYLSQMWSNSLSPWLGCGSRPEPLATTTTAKLHTYSYSAAASGPFCVGITSVSFRCFAQFFLMNARCGCNITKNHGATRKPHPSFCHPDPLMYYQEAMLGMSSSALRQVDKVTGTFRGLSWLNLHSSGFRPCSVSIWSWIWQIKHKSTICHGFWFGFGTFSRFVRLLAGKVQRTLASCHVSTRKH